MTTEAIRPETAAVIARLSAIDRAHPVLDRARVEQALGEHLRALALPPLPVRWLADESAAYRHLQAGAGAAVPAWQQALDDALDAACNAAAEAFRDRDDLVHEDVLSDVRVTPGWWADVVAERVPERHHTPSPVGRAGPGWSWLSVCEHKIYATRQALKAAVWTNTACQARPLASESYGIVPPAIERYVHILLPFVEASAAGLWRVWITAEEIVAVPRPVIRIEAWDLHASDGPAIAWADGQCFWYWRGIEVPRAVIEDPASITAVMIEGERNTEIRRIMIERFGGGAEKGGGAAGYLQAGRAERVDHDPRFGTLWRKELVGDEPLVMVEVVNATREPDGSAERYFLRVPPTMTSAREAVAWSFGKATGEYRPAVES